MSVRPRVRHPHEPSGAQSERAPRHCPRQPCGGGAGCRDLSRGWRSSLLGDRRSRSRYSIVSRARPPVASQRRRWLLRSLPRVELFPTTLLGVRRIRSRLLVVTQRTLLLVPLCRVYGVDAAVYVRAACPVSIVYRMFGQLTVDGDMT